MRGQLIGARERYTWLFNTWVPRTHGYSTPVCSTTQRDLTSLQSEGDRGERREIRGEKEIEAETRHGDSLAK